MTLRVALTVFVGIAIIIGVFAFFIPHANKGGEQASRSDTEGVPPHEAPSVLLTDTYKKGVHTILGSIMAPTPCTTVSADTSTASGTPEVISITILMPPDTGLCLQQITNIPFSVTAPAPSDARIEAYVNGEQASTTLDSL